VRTAEFERLKADPDFQALPLGEKQKLVREINAGTWSYPERPPPQDQPGEIPPQASPLSVSPAPGVTPAPGVLQAPTDVEVDEQGRVKTAPFIQQARSEIETLYPSAPIGQRVGERFGTIPQLAVESALPILGGLGGGVAGGAAGVGLGAMPGAMAGSALGEVVNQALGITAPSAAQVGLAAAGPAVGAGVAKGLGVAGKAVSQTAKAIPGLTWERGREKAFGAIERAIARRTPTTATVDTAYETARGLAGAAPTIPMKNTTAAITEWAGRQAKGPALSMIEKRTALAMKQTENLLAAPTTTFQDVVNQFDRIGTLVAEKGRKPGAGQIKHLWGSIVQDLEAAGPTHPAAAALREAAGIYKQRIAMLDFDEAVQAAQKLGPGKAAGDRLVKGLEAAKAGLPTDVYDTLTDVVAAFRSRPDRPIGQLSMMLGGAIGFASNPWAGLTMLAPRAVIDGLRAHTALNPITSAVLTAGYQGARRLALQRRREAMAGE
jgi:hypothetical protein